MTLAGGQRDTVALVPLRDPGVGKSRLSPHLSHGQRRALALAMMADVVRALQASRVTATVVVAGGHAATRTATQLGLPHVRDTADVTHLDESLASAVATLAPRGDVLVVMADLPALAPEEIDQVLGTPGNVVVAPSGDGGTGGLLWRGQDRVPFSYGPGSGARHLAAGRRAGDQATSLDLPGFRRDIDTWQDLRGLAHAPSLGASTAALLDRLPVLPTDQISPERSCSSTTSFTSAR